MEDTNKELLNPWFSMWIQPRATIQQIIDDTPEYMVLPLAALTGLVQTTVIFDTGSSYDWLFRLLLIVIGGPIVGIILLYASSNLIHWIGEKSGGKASPEEIRAAIAWSNIPILWTSLLLSPLVILSISPNTTQFIDMIATLWTSVVFITSLAQVQGFSICDAVCNSLKASFVLAIIGAALFKAILHFV